MKFRYVVLTDNIRRGTIVKMSGRYHYEYDNGEWKRTGIMTDYFIDSSPAFELYKEITEEEAMKLISEMK